MKKLLKGLNESIGVRGSLVITMDGVIVETCLKADLDADTIAALASSVLKSLAGPGSSRWLGEPARFILSAKHGTLVFEVMESLVLVVVTEADIDLDITLLEILGLANRLQRLVRITV